MPDDRPVHNRPVRTVTIGTRYPEDRAALLEVLRVRRGDVHTSDTVRHALDRALEDAGLLDKAA